MPLVPSYVHTQSRELAHQVSRGATRLLSEARGALGQPLNAEAQEAYLMNIREVRVLNDMKALDLTLINNMHGPGVVVSKLGFGSASQAGMLVGDVIEWINGTKVKNHQHAFDAMRECTCRDLAFSVVGNPRKMTLDKSIPGKLEITLANRKKGPGVVVEGVGIMGIAAGAGISAGDVVLSINGGLVNNHQEAIVIMDSSERFIDIVLAEATNETFDGISTNEMPSGAASDEYRLWGDEGSFIAQ